MTPIHVTGRIKSRIGYRTFPWKPWFAWRPVTTISGQRIWLRSIFKRTWSRVATPEVIGHEYGTVFDILKDNGG